MPDSTAVGALLDHTQDKVVLLDGDGRFTYANAAVESMLGYDPEELLGAVAFDYIHPDDVADVEAAFEETLASEAFAERTVEYRFRASDGSWVWLQSRMSNSTAEDLDGYVVSSRDITDRVVAERDRDRTATRLAELAAASNDVLWMFNSDWSETLFVNAAYEDVYGRPVEEVEADPSSFLDAVHPDDVPAVKEAMARLASGQPVEMEYRTNPSEDYGVWVWVQAKPIFEDGEVVRITGFTRDVTSRRRRERQLYVMDNLLRHNLRNDLTAIMGTADIIEDRAPELDELTAAINETGEELLESAEKERDIIQLLTTDLTHRRFEVREVLQTSAATVEARFDDVKFQFDCPESVTVRAVEQFRLALTELVENAVQHSDDTPPTVRLATRRDDHTARIVVEDEGPQFPEMDARVLTGDHEMDEMFHSTGLGLWLVYWAVELSGGSIAVSSADNGNRVEVTLPRVDDPADDGGGEHDTRHEYPGPA